MKCLICSDPMHVVYKDLFDDRYGAPGKYSIYKCNNCGFGRFDPIINQKDIGQFYSKYYPLKFLFAKQVKKEANIKPKWLAWLMGTNNIAHLFIKPNSTVLDIGSASGQSLIEIVKLGGTAYGVEPDPNGQKIAKDLNLNVYKGLITDNPFLGKKFDYVTASQVLEHDSNPKIFLKAIMKKVDKNGVVILSFPNKDSLYNKIFGRMWINWHVPYHCNFFTNKSFSKLAKRCGFNVVRVKTVTPNMWTILQLRRLFTNPLIGEKSVVWNGKSTNNTTKITVKILLIIAQIMMIPINRIIDFIGQGDSLIVWLEKKN